PDGAAGEGDPAADGEEDTAAGRNHLAALLEAKVERPRVAEHGRRPREDPAEVRDVVHARERRREALEEVEGEHRDREAAAVRPPDVGSADRTASMLPDVLVPESA